MAKSKYTVDEKKEMVRTYRKETKSFTRLKAEEIRSLMEGERVPIVKTSETWQLQLSNIFQLESNAEIGKEAELSDGITYREYLKVLLFAERRETLCMRALDLLELNTGIQADGCITQLKIQSICQLQRGVTYTFQTNYKYK